MTIINNDISLNRLNICESHVLYIRQISHVPLAHRRATCALRRAPRRALALARGLYINTTGLRSVCAEHVLRGRTRPGDGVSAVFILALGQHAGKRLPVPSGLHGCRRRRLRGVRGGHVQGGRRERGVQRLSGKLVEPPRERRGRGLQVRHGLHRAGRRGVLCVRGGQVQRRARGRGVRELSDELKLAGGERRFDGLQVRGGLHGRGRRRVHGVRGGEVQGQRRERRVRELLGER